MCLGAFCRGFCRMRRTHFCRAHQITFKTFLRQTIEFIIPFLKLVHNSEICLALTNMFVICLFA